MACSGCMERRKQVHRIVDAMKLRDTQSVRDASAKIVRSSITDLKKLVHVPPSGVALWNRRGRR